MNYLSVCSGVEAATVAWHDLGWNPVAFSEIEKFPSEVLAHHYPDVPNLGDMSNYKEWNFGEKTIDLLVGGTPCQSFSVAGLRKGLEDPRGNLALIYVGILDKFRPKWFIWENVPGVLSSSKGRDFGSFLGAVGELGYGFSYRVLDAQNFGVPQRRRRVFVVGHLGNWQPAAEVLFEPESLSRHIEEGRKKRKDIAKCLTTGIGTRLDSETDTFVTIALQDIRDINKKQGGKGWNDNNKSYTLDTMATQGVAQVFENHPADSRVKQMGDTCQTVTAGSSTGGGNIPFVLNNPTAYSIREDATKNNMSVTELDVSNCLSSHQPSIMSHHAQTFVMDKKKEPAHMFKIRGGSPVETGTQGGTPGKQAGKGYLGQDEKTFTINTTQDQHLFNNTAVRKLTPTECERLQGFPDGYTNIKENCPDGHRYKAMGNSMAVPVMKWIGERINNYKG